MVGGFPLWFLVFVPTVVTITLASVWYHKKRFEAARQHVENQIEQYGVNDPKYCCTTCSRLFETKYQGTYHSCTGTPTPHEIESEEPTRA